MVKAITFRIPIEQLGLRHTLSDHAFGNLLVIGQCLLLLFTVQADGLMIVHGKNAFIQLLVAPGTRGGARKPLFPIIFHGYHPSQRR